MDTDAKIFEIRNKKVIERYLRENPMLHLYELGDLDDFFWPRTRWICMGSRSDIHSILLVYQDIRMPVLLALNHKAYPPGLGNPLSLKDFLPPQLNAHLSAVFRDLLTQIYEVKSSGMHYKMGLKSFSSLPEIDSSKVMRLERKNRNELLELYRISYPGNWFNEKMLETGQYYGLLIDRRLVSVAGVHVYSQKYRVAALGNITTHPRYRNQGLAKTVTTFLIDQLAHRVDHVGLNVHTENLAAIRCYQEIGFEIMDQYEECSLRSRV